MIMRKFFYLIILLFIVSCGSVKEVPIQTVEKVVYKDSLVYVHDSIKVKVPYEIIVESVMALDTSYIKTSIAESIAYLDTTKRKIHHTLTQRGELKIVYDTIIKTKKHAHLTMLFR